MAARKSTKIPALEPVVMDWIGVSVRRVEFAPASVIFSQGDPCTSVLYVDQGAVRLSVVSHAGKEAVIADVQSGHFFGEGCLAGQPLRMSTATATSASTVMVLERQEVVPIAA